MRMHMQKLHGIHPLWLYFKNPNNNHMNPITPLHNQITCIKKNLFLSFLIKRINDYSIVLSFWCRFLGSNVMSMDFHPQHQTIPLAGTNVGEISIWEIGTRERMVHKPFKVWDLSACSMPFQKCPLKCWRGGLCLSRSIGDRDVGEFIIPVPHVKQVKLSSAGGLLVISSDGVWDALSTELALECSPGLAPESAATQIVKGLS
ncbi:unnamed protein product [Lactuca saligna]|uniref:PPM-type phosphatase domain-containing protein n=1 Tax=Lactuca saligna TaxID=75948 RepID=A0AA36EA14_LACSI|nr:unnamed protein product [Lactuca saligna]